uniref:Uncharacterized protein n=1 Tax=Helianthus annuus TaxID=4232 RepID=A0A251VEF1_HELAN
MDSSSLIYTSPSFTINSTHDDIADIADRVVQQLRIENGFENDYDFSFSDDDNNPTQTGKQIQPDERDLASVSAFRSKFVITNRSDCEIQ